MAGELGKALSQIDFSLNGDKESKYRELATLQAHEQYNDKRKQTEMASQVAYTKYEEQISEFSDSLLENDRTAIRGVAKQGQEFLREQLKLHGGSYKKFMESGGIRILANYKSNIVNSEEARRYKSNAKNMASIIKARDAGKSSLISSVDMKNLTNYEANGYGDITYNGLLTPIEKIDQNAYDFGADINPAHILEYGNNNSAIMSNYMRENPDKGVPSKSELISYTNSKYGAVGKNQASLQYGRNQRKAASRLKKEQDKYGLYTLQQTAVDSINNNTDGSAGFSPLEDYEKFYSRGRAHKGIISDTKYTDVSETEVDSSWNPFTWGNDVNNTRPRGAYEFSAFNGSFPKASREIYKDNYNEETGKYKFRSSDLYGANGHKLDLDETHDLKPKTVILAQTGKGINKLSNNKNEETFFAIEFSDSKGHLENKKNKEYLNQMQDTNLQYRPWEVWEDSDGTLYYKEMDTEGLSNRNAYVDAIGNQDNLNTMVQENKTQKRKNAQNFINRSVQNKNAVRKVNQLYQDNSFRKNISDKVINENGFSANPDVFETMVVAFARAGGGDTSINGINLTIDRIGEKIPIDAFNTLRRKNLKPEDALASVYKGMIDEGNEKKDVDLFIDFWKSTYESKTGKKINFNKE